MLRAILSFQFPPLQPLRSSSTLLSFTARKSIRESLYENLWEKDQFSSLNNTEGVKECDVWNGDAVAFEECRRFSRLVDDAAKKLQKKITSLESQKCKIDNVDSVAARAQLLVSNLHLFKSNVKSAVVIDWENDGKEIELELNTKKYESAQKEADALFSIVRRLRRGSERVNIILDEEARNARILNESKVDLELIMGDAYSRFDVNRFYVVKQRLLDSRLVNLKHDSTSIKVNNGFTKKNSSNIGQRRNREKTLSKIRKLKSPAGNTVLVGKNCRGNEMLSLSIARDTDVWMHARSSPGAHVLIRNRGGNKQTTITQDCLNFGANLAIFYSDLRNEEKAMVTAAKPKHITKPKNAKLGAVKLREEWKTLVGRPLLVPDYLKEIREESGQSDEYHITDKAKNQKRTRIATEDERAKRKQQVKERKKKN